MDVAVTHTTGKRHATGCTPKKAKYDQLAARLLSTLGAFRVLARHSWCADLVGVIGSSPVLVEVKSPAEESTWRVYDDVKGITLTGLRFMPPDFATWRATLFDQTATLAPPSKTGLVRTYAVAPTSQLFRYVLDYPELALKYADWSGLRLPRVKTPDQVMALLALPKENAANADVAMHLIALLNYAIAEVLVEDDRVRGYRICYAASWISTPPEV